MPYFSLGAGLAGYDPVHDPNRGRDREYTKQEAVATSMNFVPVGAGVKFNVSPGINIDLGYRMNFVDADNLDGYARLSGHKGDRFSYGVCRSGVRPRRPV